MARRGHGVGHMIPAPAIVTDPDLGIRLRREPSVATTLEAGPSSDLVVFSPGILEPESVLVRSGFLTARGMDRLRGLGAVTDLFSHFVDAEGRPVSAELEHRTIAVTLDAVKRAKRTLAIGWGPSKARPLVVCMRSGLAKSIIIDEDTARLILELGASA
ncbi:sugar-binding domain-containing protein [Schaalia hyovaginalis]|nr:sugar-binding domain-containing protein [Schaalia hyovaginalis]MDY2669858.1 sugar-binding domain-containing protein [Schaalia hyovaginalis]